MTGPRFIKKVVAVVENDLPPSQMNAFSVVGDVNGSGNANGLDVTYSVNYFKYGYPPPQGQCPNHPCAPHYDFQYKTGDVNGSCTYNGVDITYMVSYFKWVPIPLQPCPACPPLGWEP